MANIEMPIPGAWYLANESDPQPFIVTDFDERLESISIRFEDGYADEIDLETWEQWAPEQADLPDHDFGCPSDADAEYDEVVDHLAETVVRDLGEIDSPEMPDADFAA
jgi:hypothetical protein